MASLKELLAQRASLEEQITAAQSQERNEAIGKIKSLMADYGLTIADLSTKTPKAKAATVAAKYLNKATGETWSGRGLQPKWLKAAMAGGAKIEDFKI